MMNYETLLRYFGCDRTSTLDDIKKSYRKLTMTVHPDLNPGVDPKAFIDLQTKYDWLVERHTPKKKAGSLVFYRILADTSPLQTTLPIEFIEEATTIKCMYGSKEFNVHLDVGMRLPLTLRINNVFSVPIEMRISHRLE